jgi:polysaccharide biosynthesis/export protein
MMDHVRLINCLLLLILGGFAWSEDTGPSLVAVIPPADYRISSGDLVRVVVFDNPELTTQFRVPASGNVSFPLIGEVKGVVRMPAADLATKVQGLLADGFLRHPQVTVEVLEYANSGVYVVGAVLNSGSVRLVPGQELSVLQAIGEAGGWAPEANQAAAQVISESEGGIGAQQVGLDPNAADFSNPMLKPGDVVIVPRADRIYVLGRVKEPGAMVLPARGQVTVSKAITMAGGLDRFARDSEVQLLRAGKSAMSVNVTAILEGKTGVDDPLLAPGDTVFVPERRF